MSVLVWSQSRITKLTDLVNSNLDFLWIVPSLHAFKDIADYSSNLSMNFTVAWLLWQLACLYIMVTISDLGCGTGYEDWNLSWCLSILHSRHGSMSTTS